MSYQRHHISKYTPLLKTWYILAFLMFTSTLLPLIAGCSTTEHPTSFVSTNSNSSSQKILRTPETTINLYFHDIQTSQFQKAYALLSSNLRDQLEHQGSTNFLQDKVKTINQQYGVITSFSVLKQDKDTTQQTFTIQVQRSGLSSKQTEQDTCVVIKEKGTWSIDKWSYDIMGSE